MDPLFPPPDGADHVDRHVHCWGVELQDTGSQPGTSNDGIWVEHSRSPVGTIGHPKR